MACQGQIRMTAAGHVLGIEMTTALGIAEARRYDVAVVSELLQAAESGMIDGLKFTDPGEQWADRGPREEP